MGRKEKRRPRRLQRGLALICGAGLLYLVMSPVLGRAGPARWLTDAQAERIGRAMLEIEVGALQEDEPDLWSEMVRSEVPLLSEQEEVVQPEELPPAEADSSVVEEVELPPVQEEPEPEEAPEETPPEEAPEAPAAEPLPEVSGVQEIDINNDTTGIEIDAAALAAATLTQSIAPASEGPQILIMHTHSTEAYTMDGEDVYTPTDTDRTDDPNYNMLRVGEEMKAVFESMGFSVIHDTNLYDYPSYTGSYARSLEGIRAMLEQYPSISVVLDVHRDSILNSDGTEYKAVTQVNGEDTAQVMLVVGTNDGGLEHPNWMGNLELAAKIQLYMSSIDPTLPRPVNLRSQRFNQHMTPCSLLVEVGTSGNTLQEALRGARYFAQAAGTVYQTLLTE